MMTSTFRPPHSLALAATLLFHATFALAQDLPGGVMQTIGIDPMHPNRVITAGSGSLYTSTDSGSSWQQTSIGTAVWDMLYEPFDEILNPFDSAVVIVATQDRGILRNTGNGEWQPAAGLPATVRSVATDVGGNRQYAGTESGVYASDDRGASWTLLSAEPGGGTMQGLAVDPQNNQVIYAGTWGKGVYRSTDGGQTWELGNSGLFDTQIFDLVLRPDTSGVIYVPTPSGIFQSVDAGSSWVRLDSPARASELTIDPTSPDRMFASTEGNGMWRSLDGGQSWQRLTGGFGDVDYFVSVGVAPDGSGDVYAGTLNQGFWISRDYGNNWTSIGEIGPPPGSNPPPAPPAPPAPSATLTVDIVDLQNGNSVPAGRPARFRVTVRNISDVPASDVVLGVSWVRTSLTGETGASRTVSASQGSCDQFECRLGTIAAGAEATVEVSGTTEPRTLGRYRLTIRIRTDGSAVWQGSFVAEIGTSVTIASSDSGGGGGAGGPGLALIVVAGLLLRRRTRGR